MGIVKVRIVGVIRSLNYIRTNITEIKPLLEDKYIDYDVKLEESIRNYGVLCPVVLTNAILCDGHKRYKVAKELGLTQIPTILTNGEPIDLFFELNNREFNINQIALLTKALDNKQLSNILKKVGYSNSPQMVFAMKYLSNLLEKYPNLYNNQLPANIWRELGHLDKNIDKYALDLMTIQGTVSEKRNIAIYLRQAQRRNELPDSIKAEKAEDVLPLLQKTAQPRRTQSLEKYEKAIANISFPKSTSIKIDTTFSEPGINLSFNIKRSELDKLDETKKALTQLFNEVPEL